MKTAKDEMPIMIGEAVKVLDGRYGRVRFGYYGNNPSAGHFEVEFSEGPPELFLWDEVDRTFTIPLPEGVTYPDLHARYTARYGSGGVFFPDGTKDSRYTVENEFCGFSQSRPVARFCGEFITAHEHASGAWRAAREHNKAHRDALGI